MRYSRLLAAAILACSVCTGFAADGLTDPRVSPPYLIEAKVFGKWQENTKSGLLRYSLYQGGTEEVETVLLIEWIAVDAETGVQTVDAQHEVALIPGVFDSPQTVTGTVLRVQVKTELCDEPQRYEIEVVRESLVKLKYLNQKHCDLAG